jgi:cell division protein FtsB
MPKRDRTRRIPVALPDMASAPEHWLRRIRVSGFAFTVLGLIVLGLVVLAPNLRTLVEQQREIAQLRTQVEDARESVGELDGEVARWSDPAYIEAQARERIYYVYPGEYTFLVIDDGAEGAGEDEAPVISDEIQSTEVDWMGALLSSVAVAATTDALPEDLER